MKDLTAYVNQSRDIGNAIRYGDRKYGELLKNSLVSGGSNVFTRVRRDRFSLFDRNFQKN